MENTFYTPGDFSLEKLTQPNEVRDALSIPHSGHTRAGVRELVRTDRVSLRSIVAWNREGGIPFHHEEQVGEDFLYEYPANIRCTTGDVWGKRTPILHPAVAAVDATQAGIDDAYLRAMQNVDLLVGGRREDSAGYVRTLVTRYAKITYNPVAFLTRAAALYTVLVIKELQSAVPTEAEWDRFTAAPRRVADINTFAAICNAQLRDARDNVYIRIEDPTEVALVQVMLALCHSSFPIQTTHALKQLWPQMVNPGVIYSCPTVLPPLSTRITSDDVEEAMHRFCAGMDCHDLWRDALTLAQCFIGRPAGGGVLGGTHKVCVAVPPSDLRIGAIGPLLAGISAEGMRSTPVDMPSKADFLYSGVVRSVFMTAAYFEAIQGTRDAHPALLQTSRGNGPQFRHLSQAATSRSLMHGRAARIATEAGWDCFSENMLCVYPASHKHTAAELFRPEKVPWWTNIIGHMGGAANKFLETWAKPARPVITPTPKVWYSHTAIGGATQLQIASSVRWLKATVNYVTVSLPHGMASVTIPLGNVNRFLPTLVPRIVLADGSSSSAVLKFPRDVLTTMALVEQLGKSSVMVIPWHDEDVEGVADLDELFGAPNPAFLTSTSFTEHKESIPTIPLSDQVSSNGSPSGEEKTEPTKYSLPSVSTPNWAQVVTDLQSPTTGRYLKAEHLADAALGRRTPETETCAQSVGMINANSLLRAAADPTETVRKARSLIQASEALMALTRTGETLQNLTKNRNLAMDTLASLTRTIGPTTSWSELTAEDSASEALKQGVLHSPNPITHGATDDPEGPVESPQDFGSATSPHASTTETLTAGGAAPVLAVLPTLGFAPPEPSSS